MKEKEGCWEGGDGGMRGRTKEREGLGYSMGFRLSKIKIQNKVDIYLYKYFLREKQ